MIVSANGIVIRLPVAGISTIGRNTQGVRVINLDSGDRVIDMTRVVHNGEDEGEEGAGTNGKEEAE
jgi:DNA gyrase subunit A